MRTKVAAAEEVTKVEEAVLVLVEKKVCVYVFLMKSTKTHQHLNTESPQFTLTWLGLAWLNESKYMFCDVK